MRFEMNLKAMISPCFKPIIYVVFVSVFSAKLFPGFNQAISQESRVQPGKSVTWDVGLELASHRDDLIVPLGFHGPGIALGLSYIQRTNGIQFKAPAQFKFDFLQNRYAHMGLTFSIDITPTILKPIHRSDKKGQFFMGLAFPFKLTNYFPFSWDDAHLYWFTINSGSLVLDWEPPLRKNKKLLFHIELPVLSRISRPPVYRMDKQDQGLAWLGFKSTAAKRQYETASISHYQGLVMRADYVANPISAWSIQFEYDRYSDPKDVWAINTSIYYSRELRKW